MDIDIFVEKLESELRKRYNQCEDFAATPCSILLATLNAVASARKSSQQLNHTGRYCADCNTALGPKDWCCPKCGGCL